MSPIHFDNTDGDGSVLNDNFYLECGTFSSATHESQLWLNRCRDDSRANVEIGYLHRCF